MNHLGAFRRFAGLLFAHVLWSDTLNREAKAYCVWKSEQDGLTGTPEATTDLGLHYEC